MAVPAHNGGRDFVTDCVAEDGWVTGAGTHSFAHALLYRLGTVLIVEEGNMLFPWETYHNAEVVSLRSVQEPEGRYSVRADRVETICGHLGEISLDNLRIMMLIAILIQAEGPIGDTADIHLLIAGKDEFALHMWPDTVDD